MNSENLSSVGKKDKVSDDVPKIPSAPSTKRKKTPSKSLSVRSARIEETTSSKKKRVTNKKEDEPVQKMSEFDSNNINLNDIVKQLDLNNHEETWIVG